MFCAGFVASIPSNWANPLPVLPRKQRTQRPIQRETKNITKILPNLFSWSGNPGSFHTGEDWTNLIVADNYADNEPGGSTFS